MTNELWIHAGFPKCASTFLQSCFYNQSDLLFEKGLFYPKIELLDTFKSSFESAKYAHHMFSKNFVSFFVKDDARSNAIIEEEFLKLSKYLHYKKTLISSENFFFDDLGMLEKYTSNFDVRVLFVVRNKADFLLSFFSQSVNNDLTTNYFFRPLEINYLSDFNCYLNKFSSVFGKNNIHVVNMEKIKGKELFDALLKIMNVEPFDETFTFPQTQNNTRWGSEYTLFMMHLNAFPTPQSFRHILAKQVQALTFKDHSAKMDLVFPPERLRSMLEASLTQDNEFGRRWLEDPNWADGTLERLSTLPPYVEDIPPDIQWRLFTQLSSDVRDALMAYWPPLRRAQRGCALFERIPDDPSLITYLEEQRAASIAAQQGEAASASTVFNEYSLETLPEECQYWILGYKEHFAELAGGHLGTGSMTAGIVAERPISLSDSEETLLDGLIRTMPHMPCSLPSPAPASAAFVPHEEALSPSVYVPFRIRLKAILKTGLNHFPPSVQDAVRAVYHGLRGCRR